MSLMLTLDVATNNSGVPEKEKSPLMTVPFEVALDCPFCNEEKPRVGDWSFYPTKRAPVPRFMCYDCNKTFNIALLPGVQKLLRNFVRLVTELTIEQNMSINALAKQWGVPESTLRALKVEIELQLALVWEEVHAVLQAPNSSQGTTQASAVLFYDEGFLKVSGTTIFLLFVINDKGEPLSVELSPTRKAADIKPLFEEAFIKTGAFSHVIVSDGASTIHKALLELRRPLIHIQHIHSGSKKVIRIHDVRPQEGRKGIPVLSLEIHGDSLKLSTISKGKFKKRIVYLSSSKKKTSRKNRSPTSQESVETSTEDEEISSPDPPSSLPKSEKKSHSRAFKGTSFSFKTGSKLGEIEVEIKEGFKSTAEPLDVTTQEIVHLLQEVQAVFQGKSITSNRAEVFNSQHDRQTNYTGRKTICDARRSLKAWMMTKFYPEETHQILQTHQWHYTASLVRIAGIGMFRDILFC